MSVVVVTGLSGSGKSTALNALEDIGYLCMDNVPVVLLPKVLELAEGAQTRLAIVVDARDKRFIAEAGDVVDDLLEQGVDVRVVYLDSQPTEIIQRFNATRRRHPLADSGDIRTAIKKETSILDDLRTRADLLVDTSNMTVHDLKKLIQNHFSKTGARHMSIKVTSFGFKHGPLISGDMIFDARFIANPYFVDRLRESTGLDPEVSSFVMAQDGVTQFKEKLVALLDFLIPRYEAEGKAYLTVGLGCTGGKHRSVALAEYLHFELTQLGHELTKEHRDERYWHKIPKPG
jgi:UPF0042 nucleotide-binding protein